MITTCFRRVSAPLCRNVANVRYGVSARGTGARWLEPASWRRRHTPVTECAKLKQSPVSGLWLFRLKGTESRVSCWSGLLQQAKATPWHTQETVIPVYRGGRGSSLAGFRSLQCPKARGLCSGKTKETPDSSPATGRDGASPVPGHGLFKFKELVSVKLERSLCQSAVCRSVRPVTLQKIQTNSHLCELLTLFNHFKLEDLAKNKPDL